ncbi:hypothetical protein TcWFU_009284 [Taenia crassiceps]|uniref:Uncharacterized protein n=1 Tax=Taenia crassiceps TaxID=6207 RepID=A0ABR4QAP7_9CEST
MCANRHVVWRRCHEAKLQPPAIGQTVAQGAKLALFPSSVLSRYSCLGRDDRSMTPPPPPPPCVEDDCDIWLIGMLIHITTKARFAFAPMPITPQLVLSPHRSAWSHKAQEWAHFIGLHTRGANVCDLLAGASVGGAEDEERPLTPSVSVSLRQPVCLSLSLNVNAGVSVSVSVSESESESLRECHSERLLRSPFVEA